jgi:hypothetical protein
MDGVVMSRPSGQVPSQTPFRLLLRRLGSRRHPLVAKQLAVQLQKRPILLLLAIRPHTSRLLACFCLRLGRLVVESVVK